jgi:release factor glutamine methyltransferase
VSEKTTDRFFDIIVSNPPYIETSVIPTLMPEVKEHEPMGALDGKEDGLYFYRKIVDKSVCYLRKGGYLFFEIGYNQGYAVSKLMSDAGFSQVKVIKDYAGLDRVVMGIAT